jgi:hypothetical protein
LKDVKAGVRLMATSKAAFLKDLHHPDTVEEEKSCDPEKYFEKILDVIRKGIRARSHAMRGENLVKNSFILLSESRSPFLTRSQLKSACLYRLNVALTDDQVNQLFLHLDPTRSGAVKTRALVAAILKQSEPTFGVSLEIPPEVRKVREGEFQSWVKNQDAHVSYDFKFKGLVPPDPESCMKVSSLDEIEKLIRDKIFERSHLGANMVSNNST